MKIGKTEFVIGARTYIMGILNVTPDSFSDGGKFYSVETALAQVEKMIAEGADIIDIGGESTRPGSVGNRKVERVQLSQVQSRINEVIATNASEFVTVDEEIARVIPVISAIRQKYDIPISVDTYKGEVAEAAILAGANLINDIWGFKKCNKIAHIAAKYQVPVCLMHNRDKKEYTNIIEDMKAELKESISIAQKAGVKDENIILDPGIGFGKTYEENLYIMKHLENFSSLGYPLLLGTSRKSMIGLTLNLPVNERSEGTVATTVMGIMKGYDFVRVHDVQANKRAAMMTDKIMRGNNNG